MSPWPTEIRIPRARDRMVVAWDDGRTDTLAASLLRRRCPSAKATRERLDGKERDIPGIAIVHVAEIGGYAVNIGFSDGHERGIYPLVFLRELADEAQAAA